MVSKEQIQDLINQARLGPIVTDFNNKLFVKDNVIYGTDSQDEQIDFMADLDSPRVLEAAYCWFSAIADELTAPN